MAALTISALVCFCVLSPKSVPAHSASCQVRDKYCLCLFHTVFWDAQHVPKQIWLSPPLQKPSHAQDVYWVLNQLSVKLCFPDSNVNSRSHVKFFLKAHPVHEHLFLEYVPPVPVSVADSHKLHYCWVLHSSPALYAAKTAITYHFFKY